MEPKISIIVPVFNVEKYVSNCINSIMNQTYVNLEIILVDDGSPDESGEICDRYALKDDRIKVIHKENGGLSDARNAGLEVATGEYISFIDSDDYIHEEFYEKLAYLIVSNNADIAQCEFLKVYDTGANHVNIKFDKSDISEKQTVLSNMDVLNNLYNENYLTTVVVWNKLYRKELFVNIRFPKGKIHEDDFTTYKLLYMSKKFALTSEALYFYQQRSDSIMGEKFSVRRLDILEAFSDQISFYDNCGLLDLKMKATRCLESNIRDCLNKVLKSDLEDKEQIFRYLVHYYKENFYLFKKCSGIGKSRRVMMYFFRYSPSCIVKLLCKLLDIRVHFIKK